MHFRKSYGPDLPIWVATEAMFFSTLSALCDLMSQGVREILAVRFQISTIDCKGDRGGLSTWLNNLQSARNMG